MDRTAIPKRPRGRPPKVKRGGPKPSGPPADTQMATSSEQSIDSNGKNRPQASGPMQKEVDTGTPTATPTGSKRSSPDTDEDIRPAKRGRTNSSQKTHADTSQSKPPSITRTSSAASEAKPRSNIIPSRRSARHATIQSTQTSEGIRPPGPPNLEVALAIALRNLQSETWRYLWAYKKEHSGEQLPTPAEIKKASWRARTAAEEVDKADRELEDAIDEIILSNSKKKGRGGARSAKTIETEYGMGINTALTDSRTPTASASNVALISSPGVIPSGGLIPPIRIPGMMLEVPGSRTTSEATT